MHDELQIRAGIEDDAGYGIEIADIRILVAKAPVTLRQFLHAPSRRGVGTEEIGAHVIVEPDDVEALFDQEPDRLRTDQPSRAGDDCDPHISPSLSVSSPFR